MWLFGTGIRLLFSHKAKSNTLPCQPFCQLQIFGLNQFDIATAVLITLISSTSDNHRSLLWSLSYLKPVFDCSSVTKQNRIPYIVNPTVDHRYLYLIVLDIAICKRMFDVAHRCSPIWSYLKPVFDCSSVTKQNRIPYIVNPIVDHRYLYLIVMDIAIDVSITFIWRQSLIDQVMSYPPGRSLIVGIWNRYSIVLFSQSKIEYPHLTTLLSITDICTTPTSILWSTCRS
jgi:hypothetical protein